MKMNEMEMLDRYMSAVAQALPESRRDEITLQCSR